MGRYAKYHVTRHIRSKIRTGRPSCQVQHSRWGSFTRNNPRILVWKISNVKTSPSRLGLETSLAKVESSRPPQKTRTVGARAIMEEPPSSHQRNHLHSTPPKEPQEPTKVPQTVPKRSRQTTPRSHSEGGILHLKQRETNRTPS